MSAWATAYVGIPFSDLGRDRRGLDCWGLVRLVYLEVAGVVLPSYTEAYVSAAERVEVAAVIGDAAGSGVWRPVSFGHALDVAVMRRGRDDCHVGVLVSERELLHVAAGKTSCIESLSAAWIAPRLTGLWRHREVRT